MARYYLVPIEKDATLLRESGGWRAPKYRKELSKTNCRGVCDFDNKTNREFYIIIVSDDGADLSEFESHSDVLKIDDKIKKEDVEKLGISLGTSPGKDDIEKSILNWLIGESKTMRTL